jgi:hypothetical protein
MIERKLQPTIDSSSQKKSEELSKEVNGIKFPLGDDLVFVPHHRRQENFPKNPMPYTMSHKEIDEFCEFMDEETRNMTPQDVWVSFYELGMIDKWGNIVPGYEPNFRYFPELFRKMEENK